MECHCCSSSDDCSVAFFGAEAEGPEDEEEATLPPGGTLANAVLVACLAATTQEQHQVCIG